ncbi:MAG: N-formylglutamate amidohydrolase [Planctomycetota bacterium]|nr:N-formylglutamate amidohydrolase [Planctomycetota bacterium]
MRSDQIVVSVEHASARVPARLEGLGLPDSWLQTHHGWDPGAALVGRFLARRFGVPLHLGRWSRLVADLNRSSFHPRVVPKTTGTRSIPANQDLSSAARQQRLAGYWLPYRTAVEADLDRVVARHGRVLHISVHSFAPRLRDQVRSNHFGLLYGPSRKLERAMADRWGGLLSEAGFRVRRNYPYSGLEDGFCMRMRAERPPRTYLGMEIEMNQRWVRRPAGARRFAEALAAVLGSECQDCGGVSRA